ncbi:MAG: sigma 54-interacting transcriptional regulator [Polyangiales bacterium]
MTACVGRERELAWLTARIESTVGEGPAFVRVVGPAGVGKTRLLDELREQCRAAGFAVLEGWCVRAVAYAPLMAVAAQALAWLRAREEHDLLAPGDLEALAPLVNQRALRARDEHDADEDEELSVRFIEAVARLLGAVGRRRPALVLLRGWDRVDAATRALVRAILDAAGPLGEPSPGAPPVLFAVASRLTDPAAHPEHPRAAQLALQGLDLDGVRKILADEVVASRLHQAAGGNPAALFAILDRLPPPREAEIASRVDELSEVGRRVLGALALADRPLPVHVVAQALDLDAQAVTRAVPALTGAGLVRRALDPGVGDVVVGLSRHEDGELVCQRLGEGELATVHGALAEALESWGRATPEEVLTHRLAGGVFARAAEEAPGVVRALLRRHAPALALDLAREVAPHAGATSMRELARLAALAARSVGAQADALSLVARAQQLNPDDGELARLEATLALASGEFDRAAAALDRADLVARDALGQGRVAATRAELHYHRGDLDATEALARKALELAGDDDETITQARNTLTKVFLVRRDLDKGWDWSLQSLERARARRSTTETLRGLINLGVVAIWRGDLDEAVRQFAAARAVSQRGGALMLQGVLRENEAVVAHLQGRFGDALQSYQEALGILTRVGNRRFLARVANNLGELYVQVGEVTRARRLCEYASQVARGLSDALAAEGLMLRAQVEIADARTDAARVALHEAVTIYAAASDREREAAARLLRVRASLVDGAVERAQEELAQVADDPSLSARLRTDRALVAAELARALGRDALTDAQRAIELAESTGDSDLRFRASVAMALSLLDRGDDAAARRHAEAAEAQRRALLGAVPEAMRVSFDAQLGRTGVGALTTRLEVLASGVRRPRPVVPDAPSGDAMGLLGESAVMRDLRRRIARVAPQDVTVLLRGESGTGKERVAEALHAGSHRRRATLVKVNCAALGEGVLLSELFGHERGAFTGADRRRRGRFELADGGTIFLDEIGDVTAATQAALLRVLQERTFERVGGNETLRVDVRIVAATNRDLGAMVREGRFREDLYFRLTSLTIQLPPLRERLEDLPLIAAQVLEREARAPDEPRKRLSNTALRRLMEHPWPGNIRELENVLRASALFADGDEIHAEDLQGLPDPARASMLPPTPTGGGASIPPKAPERNEVEVVYDRIRHGGVSLFDMRRELERGCIAHALTESGGNITRAAALLGMKRPRLTQLVREYGLAKGGDPSENDES